jgi:hypothetical protein
LEICHPQFNDIAKWMYTFGNANQGNRVCRIVVINGDLTDRHVRHHRARCVVAFLSVKRDHYANALAVLPPNPRKPCDYFLNVAAMVGKVAMWAMIVARRATPDYGSLSRTGAAM